MAFKYKSLALRLKSLKGSGFGASGRKSRVSKHAPGLGRVDGVGVGVEGRDRGERERAREREREKTGYEPLNLHGLGSNEQRVARAI